MTKQEVEEARAQILLLSEALERQSEVARRRLTSHLRLTPRRFWEWVGAMFYAMQLVAKIFSLGRKQQQLLDTLDKL